MEQKSTSSNTENLFKATLRPEGQLFFQSGDPNDLRLGQLVSTCRSAYEQSEFVVIGCPQDEGVVRNNGRAGSEFGPREIRRCFYKMTAPVGIDSRKLFDLGDTLTTGSLEEIHDRHFQVVSQLLADGKKVMVLGGGNDVSYPDCKAMHKSSDEFIAVNVDAHLDIRINQQCNSGTPYRQLLDQKLILPRRFFELGIQQQANAAVYRQQAEQMGINLIWLDEILSLGLIDCLDQSFKSATGQHLFLGFDMDSVKASDAPGVSAPSTTGLTAEQALKLVDYLTGKFMVPLFEISEVNPKYDLDSRTSRLAATLLHRYLSIMLGKSSVNRDAKDGL